MTRYSLLGLALALASFAYSQEFKVDAPVGDFTVSDLQGKSIPFSALRGDVTAVIFISTRCPISNSYNDRMSALYRDYSAKGVKFVFLNANNNEPPTEIQTHSKQAGFPFPVYKDVNNLVADRFGAQSTPEAYVIDKTGILRYHGYIDDSQNEARVQNKGLRNALDAVLAGQPVPRKETKAFGCTIKRVRKTT
jgi:thiol-disulfide isomerase/thioredoxin